MKKRTINKEKLKICLIDVITALILVIIDQLLKLFAQNSLKEQDDIYLIKDVLHLHYLENTGAAFGMLRDQKAFFIMITLLFFSLIVYVLLKMPAARKYYALHIVLAVLSAGAIGNFVDRVRLNYVVDFIYFICIDFPVFNFADICVTLATITLIILICFRYKEHDLDFLSFNNNKYRT